MLDSHTTIINYIFQVTVFANHGLQQIFYMWNSFPDAELTVLAL